MGASKKEITGMAIGALLVLGFLITLLCFQFALIQPLETTAASQDTAIRQQIQRFQSLLKSMEAATTGGSDALQKRWEANVKLLHTADRQVEAHTPKISANSEGLQANATAIKTNDNAIKDAQSQTAATKSAAQTTDTESHSKVAGNDLPLRKTLADQSTAVISLMTGETAANNSARYANTVKIQELEAKAGLNYTSLANYASGGSLVGRYAKFTTTDAAIVPGNILYAKHSKEGLEATLTKDPKHPGRLGVAIAKPQAGVVHVAYPSSLGTHAQVHCTRLGTFRIAQNTDAARAVGGQFFVKFVSPDGNQPNATTFKYTTTFDAGGGNHWNISHGREGAWAFRPNVSLLIETSSDGVAFQPFQTKGWSKFPPYPTLDFPLNNVDFTIQAEANKKNHRYVRYTYEKVLSTASSDVSECKWAFYMVSKGTVPTNTKLYPDPFNVNKFNVGTGYSNAEPAIAYTREPLALSTNNDPVEINKTVYAVLSDHF